MRSQPRSLIVRAGAQALAHIQAHGRLTPDDIGIVAGAAGGPKWLVLSQLDRILFGAWLPERRAPLALIGSSIGSWRFGAVSTADPLAAIARFEDAYIAQTYTRAPTPRQVSATSAAILQTVLGARGPAEILAHPRHRLTAIVARCRGPVASEAKALQLPGLAAAAFGNVLTPRALRLFFGREAHYDARAELPVLPSARYVCDSVALKAEHLVDVLLASGSIPLVMAGVPGLGEAPHIYRDGGIFDYHMDVPYRVPEGQLVLFPHFGTKVTPGWFDKSLPWRRASAARLASVVQLCPSPEFLAKLPNGRVPDRNDFTVYAGRDSERMRAWRQVLDACRQLADDLNDVIAKQLWTSVVTPLTV